MWNLCVLGVARFSYSLLDDGIANLLGLQTLRHGTNFFNYLSIRVYGGDPQQGGKTTGSTKGWVNDDTRNYFYLFKDSAFQITSPYEGIHELYKGPLRISAISSRFSSRGHVFLSGYNFTARVLPVDSNSNCIRKLFRLMLGLLGGIPNLLLTPTLKFRFSKIDSSRLLNDPYYHGAAYRTMQKVEWWRIGLFGSIVTGVNLNWFERFKANPLKVLTGVVQLTAAVALAVLSVGFTLASPYLFVPGLIGILDF
jgi:hypothetical protein